MAKELIDQILLLQKYPGKGGWTYAELPNLQLPSKLPFGWIVVNGFIDHFELKKHKLMPMGNGSLFLSVRKAIRTAISKEAGDQVHVKLYLDDTPLRIPDEILACFEQEPKRAYDNFIRMAESQQQAFIDWIYSAKTEEKKVERIVKMLDKALHNKGFYQ